MPSLTALARRRRQVREDYELTLAIATTGGLCACGTPASVSCAAGNALSRHALQPSRPDASFIRDVGLQTQLQKVTASLGCVVCDRGVRTLTGHTRGRARNAVSPPRSENPSNVPAPWPGRGR